MLLAYLPALAALVGIAFFAQATGQRVWYFTNDLFVLGNLPFYAGILSNMGILLWCATAATYFFSAAILTKKNQCEIGDFFCSCQAFSPLHFCLMISFRCTRFFILCSFILLKSLFMVCMVFLPFGTSSVSGNKFWKRKHLRNP
jgi:hypothetical protein